MKIVRRLCLVALLSLVVGIGVQEGAWAASAPSAVRPSAARGAEPVGQGASASVASSSETIVSGDYSLGAGDRIRLTVYGEDDLSGEYDVGSTGLISLPLIGDVKAAGQNLRAFEKAVREKLQDGYLKDPRVSVQVMNYRPFFILGEVAKPGSYPYQNGMTVLNAVALAGGYTYRADKSGITMTRATEASKKDRETKEDETVQPGDVIRVPERFF